MPNQGNPGAAKPGLEVQVEQNIVNNINNKRPEVKDAAKDITDPLLVVYHRSMEEIEKMPVIEKTMTVCPECKLIINGIIYKDGDNVMIRKYCPEHDWTIEKYWEDYDMYMKMKHYNYYGRGFDNPNYITTPRAQNCPFDCGMCERHKSHTGLANVVITNRCHLSCWYCFFYAKEGEAIYEPSSLKSRRYSVNLRSQKPIPANAIQITGGEPTMSSGHSRDSPEGKGGRLRPDTIQHHRNKPGAQPGACGEAEACRSQHPLHELRRSQQEGEPEEPLGSRL